MIIRPGDPRAGIDPFDRREFVRRTAGGLVLLSGCSGELGLGSDVGRIALSILGLTSAAADGGSVLVEALSGSLAGQTPQTFTIPSSGNRTEDLPEGQYRLTYTPPGGFMIAAGGTDQQTVTVTIGNTESVSFSVEENPPSTGTLQVQVTGVGSGAANGGSVAVTGVNVSFATTNYTVPVSGTLSVTLPVGTFTVNYSPPVNHTVNAGVTNPQNAAVADSQTTVVQFAVTDNGGGGGGAADIYEHGFEDGTGGQFVNGSFQPFIPNTAWQLDNTTAARGTNSVRQDYPIVAGNTGDAFYYRLSSILTAVYIRLAYRQSNPFNNGNSDTVKMIRSKRLNLAGNFGSLVISGGGAFSMTWENYATTFPQQQMQPNTGVQVNANDFAGNWFWIEYYIELTNTTTGTIRLWIDDVLTHDYTYNNLNIQFLEIGSFQFDGTVNSVSGPASAWFDNVGISTQKMGIP